MISIKIILCPTDNRDSLQNNYTVRAASGILSHKNTKHLMASLYKP